MNTSDFIHPDDAAAIKSLESIPANIPRIGTIDRRGNVIRQ